MAGSSSLPPFTQCLPITTVIEQFEVEYAKHVNYPPLETLVSKHASLLPHSAYFRNRFRGSGGAWLKFTHPGVFLRLLPGTFTGSGDAVLIVYHRYKVLEEHYVSRLHFSWPQVTCISGFPARGTRAVVLSYRDGGNLIQKFAFRFSTTQETDRFISALKDTLEDTRPEVSNAMLGSGLSSQQEFDPSNCPSYISVPSIDESWRSELSLDSSSRYIPTTTDHEAAQASNDQRLILSNQAEEIISTFPPSFTSFLMNCCPTAEQGATKPTNPGEIDFKNQLLNYMKDPSFKDILSKAEQLITELGDNVQFP